MAPREDLGALYAKHMEHFGCGIAMFQPVSATDMRPPCIGYLDDDRRWNLITNIEWLAEDGLHFGNTVQDHDLKPLERAPRKMEQLGIEWRPRTSIGVRQLIVDASGQTPSTGLPAGADAHIKYKSNTKFGAVLITQKPVTLTSYNDETLFQSWLTANKAQLSSLHGNELRRYGACIVTRTYTCPGCSINAWDAKGKEANVSMKAKASMVGELGEDLDWSERLVDKDWSHYYGQNRGDNVVVFFDGIEVPASTWWWEGLRGRFTKSDTTHKCTRGSQSRVRSHDRQNSSSGIPRAISTDHRPEDYGLLSHDLWGSSMPLRESPIPTRSISRGRQPSSNEDKSPSRSMSTPRRLSKYIEYDQRSTSSRPRTEHGLPAPEIHFEEHPLTPRTRFLVPEPPSHHPSTSTNTSTSSTKTRKPITIDAEISPPASILRRPLHRKAASLSLPHPPGENSETGHNWNPF